MEKYLKAHDDLNSCRIGKLYKDIMSGEIFLLVNIRYVEVKENIYYIIVLFDPNTSKIRPVLLEGFKNFYTELC
jgi:hypothetical protein